MKLWISNICYANVSGLFAMFNNPKNRGSNFTWEFFVRHCEEESEIWLVVNDLLTSNNQINIERKELAKKFAKEIAETLVKRLTE